MIFPNEYNTSIESDSCWFLGRLRGLSVWLCTVFTCDHGKSCIDKQNPEAFNWFQIYDKCECTIHTAAFSLAEQWKCTPECRANHFNQHEGCDMTAAVDADAFYNFHIISNGFKMNRKSQSPSPTQEHCIIDRLLLFEAKQCCHSFSTPILPMKFHTVKRALFSLDDKLLRMSSAKCLSIKYF